MSTNGAPKRPAKGESQAPAARQDPTGESAERRVTLTNKYGLHMRPSKQVVELANSFPCEISIVACGQEVDAKSILGLIGLGAECGTEVLVRAKGPRAEEAVEKIANLLKTLPELHAEPREYPRQDESTGPTKERKRKRGGTA